MDKKKIHGLYRALEQLRGMRKMPLQMASLLIYVAQNEGITMGDLADQLTVSQSACSRLVATLGKSYRTTEGDYKDGTGLLETREDPKEHRRKIVFLTAKGKKLIEQINSALA